MPGVLYSDSARELQDRFDTRRLADRLQQLTVHDALTDADRAFVARCSMFFLATVDADGWPDVSYKGGMPGFVQSVDDRTLVFPSYDGNGMFRSLGNVIDDTRIAMLFIDFTEPNRMRVHGRATVTDDAALLAGFEGADLLVRVSVERIFPNCPRYLHKLSLEEHSVYAPRPGHAPPQPEWKQLSFFADVLPSAGS